MFIHCIYMYIYICVYHLVSIYIYIYVHMYAHALIVYVLSKSFPSTVDVASPSALSSFCSKTSRYHQLRPCRYCTHHMSESLESKTSRKYESMDIPTTLQVKYHKSNSCCSCPKRKLYISLYIIIVVKYPH